MAITTELDRDACTKLLQSNQLGRIAFITDDHPTILPINYIVHEGMIVFRTDPGEKLNEIPMRRVAFEIDGVGPGEAWSVLVRGHAREITTALGEAYEALRAIPVPIWAPGDKEHWIAIEIIELTGRLIR